METEIPTGTEPNFRIRYFRGFNTGMICLGVGKVGNPGIIICALS